MLKYGIIAVVVIVFIGLDFLTGIIKAFKNKAYNSSVMREGLYHKFTSIIICVGALMVDIAQIYVDIGVNVPIFVSVCVYIVTMEIGSIIENVCAVNPHIMPDKLKQFFAKLNGGGKDG